MRGRHDRPRREDRTPEAATEQHLVVAIDGPSGSGKSSVSRAVARALGAAYLDTGAMYRALTWWLLAEGVDLRDSATVIAKAPDCPLNLGLDPDRAVVTVGGRDVGREIRSERVTGQVSTVATIPEVRRLMCRWQRRLITDAASTRGTVVAEGRDITTVVAPDAQVRILLTASEAARLARRAQQTHGAVDDRSLRATRDLVVERDRVDSTVSAFTSAVDGVTLLDTSALDFDASVAAVLDIVRASA